MPYEPSPNALAVLNKRYLRRHPDGSRETPDELVERIVTALAETPDDKEAFRWLLENKYFMPNTPTWLNAGHRGYLSACVVLPIDDSIDDIFTTLRRAALVTKSGAGIGYNFSALRPAGSPIASSGATTSGTLSFIDDFAFAINSIQQGNFRRGAQMGLLNAEHPDIWEFIHAKQDLTRWTNFNVSVMITDALMAKFTNEPDKSYEISWATWGGEIGYLEYQSDGSVRPKKRREAAGKLVTNGEFWNTLVTLAHKTGEPGLLFYDTINKNDLLNPVCGPITACNPCITGDTLIAVADGRNPVSIKQLADEGKDVPVHCWNPKTGRLLVRTGRSPRLTRKNADILRINFYGGSFLRVTPDHKIYLRNGKTIAAKNLKPGDSVAAFTKRQTPNPYTTRGKLYWDIINARTGKRIKEHQLINKFFHGKPKANYVTHHIDGNSLNNCPDNLSWVSISEHSKLEASIHPRKGKDNPRYGAKLTKETKQKIGVKTKERFKDANFKKRFSKAICKALNNPAIKQKMHALRAKRVVRHCKACKIEFVVIESSNKQFCSRRCIFAYHNNLVSSGRKESFMRALDKRKQAIRTLQLEVFTQLSITLTRQPLRKELVAECKRRGICSEIGRPSSPFVSYKHLLKAAESFNHRVASIVSAGKADVYNITVDDVHNYVVITDPILPTNNKYISHKGVRVVNCGEQPLHPYQNCVLGSINLAQVLGPTLDWPLLELVINHAVNFLDRVIDVNVYPIPELETQAKLTRQIGLGIMGWADLLFQLKIPYDSEAALDLARRVGQFLKEKADSASQNLAALKGPAPCYSHEGLKHLTPRRNAKLLTCAPTGSVSILADCSGGIEPLFSLVLKRHILSDATGTTKLVDVNPVFHKFIKANYSESAQKELLNFAEANGHVETCPVLKPEHRGIFKTALLIAPEWHVKMQAAWQENIDSAVSKSCNLPATATVEDVKQAYLLAHQLGCKGITVYRDGCRAEQPMQIYTKKAETVDTPVNLLAKVPDGCPATKFHQATPWGKMHLVVVRDPVTNKELECFAQIGRAGDIITADLEGISRLISLCLRSGVTIDRIMDTLLSIGSKVGFPTKEGTISSISDAVARILRRYLHREPSQPIELGYNSGMKCPECGGPMINESGCWKCLNTTSCGYSKCG